MNYKSIQQFCIPTYDKPGVLGELSEVLGKSGINIIGLNTQTQGDMAFIRFYCQEAVSKVETALKASNYHWFTTPGFLVELPNKPGELGRFSSFVGKQGISIHNVYGISEGQGASAKLIFTVDMNEKFEKALKQSLASVN